MHSATWSPSSPSSLAYCKFDSPASSAEQGTRLSHYRGQGPVPPQGVHRKELAGLLESLAWSSFKGEEANLVSPFSPVCGGLMGGALREALPTSFSVASLGICATIDPALTRHLSDSAHNDIVRALRAAPELIDHHDLHNGRCIVTCGFRGDSGPVGVALSIDRTHPPEKVTDIHISYPNGRGLSAPVHAPAVMLAGLAVVLPERIKLDDPWLVNVLAGLVQFSVNVSHDPGDPAMRTVELSNAAQRVQLRLCETPDGRHEIEEATLELRGVTSQQCSTAATPAAPVASTSTDSLQAQMNNSRPAVAHPEAGFSYARGLVLENERSRIRARKRDADQRSVTSGLAQLENAIKAAQGASSDSWTPTSDPRVWRITVTPRTTPVSLRVVFDDDRLNHACDVRTVQGDDGDVRPRAQGRRRPHYELWTPSLLNCNGRATLVTRWFNGSPAFDAWVKANQGRKQNDIIDDALDACARLDRHPEGTAHTEHREDGSSVGVAALAADLHIYRYDVVLAEKDVSMVLQFTHANRRVLRRIAVLQAGVSFDQIRKNFCADPGA